MNFNQVNSAFENSLSGTIQIHLVHNELVNTLFQNISRYRKIRFENDPEPDTEIFTLLSSLRFHFAMAPVSPGRSEFGMGTRLNELEVVAQLASDSKEKELLQSICECLREMEKWTDLENPLLVRLLSLADDKPLLLHAITRFRPTLLSLVEDSTFADDWRVTESNSLVDLIGYPNDLVVFGHPMFHESQEYRTISSAVPRMLRDPVSRNTTVIMYGDQGEPAKVDGLLNSNLFWKREQLVLRDNVPESVPDLVEMSQDDIAHLQYRISRNSKSLDAGDSASADEETVEARMVLLRNGRYVLKNFSQGSHQYVVEKRGDSIVCRSVDVSNIQSGSWIIERASYAESDMIEAVANSRFGATKFRNLQHEWKAEVRRALRTYGPRRLARMLADDGVRVNPQSIQHWGNDPHSIGPDSLERVQAMCKVIELENPEQIWAAMQKLRSAHISAGHAVRDDLEDAVREKFQAIKEEVEESGMATVHLDGCGDLGIFLVEEVAPEPIEVPVSELNFVKTESEND
jgi:hypothetical protein